MRNIDRLKLIDSIGRKLQSSMTYPDIAVYLKGFGIDANAKAQGKSFGSKWVYSKEVLSDEPEDVIIAIADELELDHPFTVTKRGDLSDSKFWLPNHFKLFLTHLSSFKAQTSNLQKALRHYGISGFVAHEDIEPTKEWLIEIEKALFSMDALAAILMPGFHESSWTDHEVGVAVGRDVLVIPIRKGIDPYGFIGKYQGLQANNKTVGQVACAIFKILLSNAKTKDKMIDCLVDQFLLSGTVEDANRWLKHIGTVDKLPQRHSEKIIENYSSNNFISGSKDIRDCTNELLKRYGMNPLLEVVKDVYTNDEIPF